MEFNVDKFKPITYVRIKSRALRGALIDELANELMQESMHMANKRIKKKKYSDWRDNPITIHRRSENANEEENDLDESFIDGFSLDHDAFQEKCFDILARKLGAYKESGITFEQMKKIIIDSKPIPNMDFAHNDGDNSDIALVDQSQFEIGSSSLEMGGAFLLDAMQMALEAKFMRYLCQQEGLGSQLATEQFLLSLEQPMPHLEIFRISVKHTPYSLEVNMHGLATRKLNSLSDYSKIRLLEPELRYRWLLLAKIDKEELHEPAVNEAIKFAFNDESGNLLKRIVDGERIIIDPKEFMAVYHNEIRQALSNVEKLQIARLNRKAKSRVYEDYPELKTRGKEI